MFNRIVLGLIFIATSINAHSASYNYQRNSSSNLARPSIMTPDQFGQITAAGGQATNAAIANQVNQQLARTPTIKPPPPSVPESGSTIIQGQQPPSPTQTNQISPIQTAPTLPPQPRDTSAYSSYSNQQPQSSSSATAPLFPNQKQSSQPYTGFQAPPPKAGGTYPTPKSTGGGWNIKY